MKKASSWMLRRVAFVRTDVSEELSASIIGVTRICELGTTLAEIRNRRKPKLETDARFLSSEYNKKKQQNKLRGP
jgi:hypothetical protein